VDGRARAGYNAPMFTSLASFHPGHGTTQPGSVVHYLVEPVHVVSVVLAVAALVVAAGALWFALLRKANNR